MTWRHGCGSTLPPGGSRAAVRGALAAGLLLAFVAGGCPPDVAVQLQEENSRLRATLAEKDKEWASKQAKLDDLQQRLPNATRFTDDELKRLFYPERIEIDRLSGGEDYDNKPGDDGVTVYLRPVDKQGDVIKVPGDITLQLYDLAADPARNRIGEYRVPADQCSALWHGKLLTNHYTIKCPWPHGPPEHNEITIRVTFVDYFTKRILSAHATCTVKLPPPPTSAPSSR